MRPTLAEIAREADVSHATVDRVLNARAGVKARTRAHVFAVAHRLGYLQPETLLLPLRPVRLHFLLPEGTNAYVMDLADQVRRQAANMENIEAIVETIAGFDPRALASRLTALRGASDGVALVAIDHPTVRDAVRALTHSGTPVLTIASDIHNVPRLAYIGIDNGQAGRLAGYVLGRFLGKATAAKVALFAGSLAYRGHQEREMGFRQVLTEDFPAFEIAELREVHDNRERAYAETIALFAAQPDLAAIYNAGGATAGIARALKALGRDQDVVFVAHDATEGNKALLLDDTLDAVIDQNAGAEIREALTTLVNAARGTAHVTTLLRLQIIFRENLPLD